MESIQRELEQYIVEEIDEIFRKNKAGGTFLYSFCRQCIKRESGLRPTDFYVDDRQSFKFRKRLYALIDWLQIVQGEKPHEARKNKQHRRRYAFIGPKHPEDLTLTQVRTKRYVTPEELDKLEVGDTLPYYGTNQDCTFTIKRIR